MKPPTISVLMLAYNHELYAAQALESVLCQNLSEPFEFQLVIGEDRSTDETLAILKQYKARFPDKVKLLDRPTNLGMMQNFIDTYNNCDGEFIALLECDDFWTDNFKLEKQLHYMIKNPTVSACFHNVTKMQTGSDGSEQSSIPAKPKPVKQLRDMWTTGPFFTCTAMLRRSCMPELPNFFDTLPIADWPLFMLFANAGPLGYIDEPMATYRVHSEGIWSGSSSASQLLSDVAVLESMNQHFGEQHSKSISAEICKRYCWLGHNYADAQDYVQAKVSFHKALQYNYSSDIGAALITKLFIKLYAPKKVVELGRRLLHSQQ